MSDGLSKGVQGLQRYLAQAEVLEATVAQLRKDLSLGEEELRVRELGEHTFEDLQAQVLPVLEQLIIQGSHALQVAIYRVDLPEKHMRRTLAAGGMDALAAETVLRCLQKVLTRLRYAGRF